MSHKPARLEEHLQLRIETSFLHRCSAVSSSKVAGHSCDNAYWETVWTTQAQIAHKPAFTAIYCDESPCEHSAYTAVTMSALHVVTVFGRKSCLTVGPRVTHAGVSHRHMARRKPQVARCTRGSYLCAQFVTDVAGDTGVVYIQRKPVTVSVASLVYKIHYRERSWRH